MRVKIHLNNNLPFDSSRKRVLVQTMEGLTLHMAKKVKLKGEWIIRQYNNPVPCGELTVIYTEDPTATFEVIT